MNGSLKINYSGNPVYVSIEFTEAKLDNEIVMVELYSEIEKSSWLFNADTENDNNIFSGYAIKTEGPDGEYNLSWHTVALDPYENIE